MSPALALGVGLEALLTMPAELARLRAELAGVRQELAAISGRLPPMLVSTREAAERLGVSAKTIRRLAAAGEIRTAKIGGLLRIDLASAPAAHDNASLRAIPPRPARGPRPR